MLAALMRRLRSPVALAMVALIAVAAAARLALFPQVAYMAPNPAPFSDLAVWEVWSRTLWQYGLDDLSMVSPRTYVGYHYVFWAVGEVYGLFSPDFVLGTPLLLYLEKTPPVLFDLALLPLIFAASRRVARLLPDGLAAWRELGGVQALERRGLAAEDSLGLAAAAVFAFLPAVLYDSAVWGQSESVISFFMLAAVLALATGRVTPAWAFWAIAFVVKPQPVVVVPALAAFTFWRFGPWGIARAVAGACAGGLALLGYLLATGNGPYIVDVYRELFRTYDAHISINAWNIWWYGNQHGLHASDALVSAGPAAFTVEQASFVLLVLSTLATLTYLRARLDLAGLLVACAMLEFAFYILPLSTHERYLYPFFVFLAPVIFLRPRWLLAYAPLSVVFFLNIFAASPSDPDMSKAFLNSGFGFAMAWLNVACFVITVGAVLSATFRGGPRLPVSELAPGAP